MEIEFSDAAAGAGELPPPQPPRNKAAAITDADSAGPTFILPAIIAGVLIRSNLSIREFRI